MRVGQYSEGAAIAEGGGEDEIAREDDQMAAGRDGPRTGQMSNCIGRPTAVGTESYNGYLHGLSCTSCGCLALLSSSASTAAASADDQTEHAVTHAADTAATATRRGSSRSRSRLLGQDGLDRQPVVRRGHRHDAAGEAGRRHRPQQAADNGRAGHGKQVLGYRGVVATGCADGRPGLLRAHVSTGTVVISFILAVRLLRKRIELVIVIIAHTAAAAAAAGGRKRRRRVQNCWRVVLRRGTLVDGAEDGRARPTRSRVRWRRIIRDHAMVFPRHRSRRCQTNEQHLEDKLLHERDESVISFM
mmetsp:Transcript_9241/g.26009  ORF Transcript_9241/g.26009 Transcript_9241/m.26009 type:complete len:302 (+) Transcript_9241:1280-2185(+)